MLRLTAYVHRDLIRWSRAPLNVISTLVMPAAWLIFVGLVMPVRFDGNYLDFVTPGVLILTMLTAGLAAGSSLMFDKVLGYLNKFLALPSPRESILAGKILFTTLRGLIQATAILVIATLIGSTLLSPLTYLGMYMVLALFGVTLSSLGATMALYLPDHDSYAAFNRMVSMPLYFASSALIPLESMPGALRVIATVNPLTYAIDSIRDIAAGVFPLQSILILACLALIMLAICGRKFRKVTLG